MTKNKNKHFFVVLEGPDGVGKTTLMRFLKAKFNASYHNFDILFTEQPWKTNTLRPVLLKTKQTIAPLTEALMFILDRHLHWKYLENWRSQHHRSTIILCDRYFYSTFVYQGLMGKIPFSDLKLLHQNSNAWHLPDLVFFLEISHPALLHQRIVQKSLDCDRFHQKINGNFTQLLQHYRNVQQYFLQETPPHPIVNLDCSQSLQTTAEQIYQIILQRFSDHESTDA